LTEEQLIKITDEYIVPAVKSEINIIKCRIENIEILLGMPGELNYFLKSEEERIDLFRERLKKLLK